MATERREDAKASETAESGEAKKRSILDIQESAGRSDLMTEDALRKRQDAVKPKRRQAGPELVAPAAAAGLGQEALRSSDDDVEETELELPEE